MTRSLRPLGLVLKAGSWYLVQVASGDAQGVDVLAIDELRSTRLTQTPFASPDGFDLASFWTRHVRGASF